MWNEKASASSGYLDKELQSAKWDNGKSKKPYAITHRDENNK